MPLKEAAAELGVSKDAVRQRVRRGTLRSDKGEDGRVYVYLDASVDDVHTAKLPPAEAGDSEAPLYREMQARIAYLEGQVAEEREARRRADTLLARLMDRVPELPAPQETPGSSPRSDAPGPHTGAQRPWWRRLFGG
jgi:hypothetical protein